MLEVLQSGCQVDSVMVDGSALPYEENLRWTAAMATHAHAVGAAVEAELGKLSGEEDGLSVPEKEAKMTDPAVVARFIRETGVDMLAVTIGNVHGVYSRPPELDFPRLEAIRRQVPVDFPLVLHGASGLPPALIAGAVQRGVCKFNVNTDLRGAALAALETAFAAAPDAATTQKKKKKKPDMLHLMEQSTAAMQAVAEEKIRLFNGSSSPR